MHEPGDRGSTARPVRGPDRTPEQLREQEAVDLERLHVLFAQGPIHGLRRPSAAGRVSATSSGPELVLRRFGLLFRADGFSVEVLTIARDRRPTYLAGLRGIPHRDEHLAEEGATARVNVAVDGSDVAFDVWTLPDNRVVAAANLTDDRAILLDMHGIDLADIELARVTTLEPLLGEGGK